MEHPRSSCRGCLPTYVPEQQSALADRRGSLLCIPVLSLVVRGALPTEWLWPGHVGGVGRCGSERACARDVRAALRSASCVLWCNPYELDYQVVHPASCGWWALHVYKL